MFAQFNQKNLSKSEMDQQRRKKRKINDISKTEPVTTNEQNQESEFKEPSKVNKKVAFDVKECPFNPFGDDSCDMCGS